MIFCLWNATDCEKDFPPSKIEADERLRDLENQAWVNYSRVAGVLDIHGSREATDEYLAARVIPAFVRIGFDEAFIQTLFRLASKAWSTLGVPSGKVIPLRPNIKRDIEAVKKGILAQADREMTIPKGPKCLTPQENYSQLKVYMDPANLHLLFDEISTPWIILPRAYAFLHRDHANYLPAYLEVIGNETNERVLHIFTRITIEFIANYTIRFADDRYSREKVIQLVAAGYTALFWKNIHTPPKGFEDIRIFEHFLTWIRNSSCLTKISKPSIDTTIQEMEVRKAAIFPSGSDLANNDKDCPDISRFIVALRHGCLGIDCAIRYFWLAPTNIQWPKDGGMRWSILIFPLKSLFELIPNQFGEESKRTQYYIREFLVQLKNTYTYSALKIKTLGKQNKSDFNFLRYKIIIMIEKLQHLISTTQPKV